MKYFSLEKLLDENGVVTRCPPKFSQRLQVVEYLAHFFASERSYTELEVNDGIRSHIAFSDYVTMRRNWWTLGSFRAARLPRNTAVPENCRRRLPSLRNFDR